MSRPSHSRPSPTTVSASAARAFVGLLAAAVACLCAVVLSPSPAGAVTRKALVGTFGIAAGAQSSSGKVTGSYFRMLQPGGTVAKGPYLANANSSLRNQTYTPFRAGTDGGLRTGTLQPEPKPGFDARGNSLAKRIVRPTPFFGVNFSVDTNAKDRQTGAATPAPALYVDGSGHLSGNLKAFDASWNRQEFNQGSPKPDGSHPGATAGPSGTYNARTHAYSLTWSSKIIGGPFSNFTGVWHLTGTFKAKAATAKRATGGTGAATTPASLTGQLAALLPPPGETGGISNVIAVLGLFGPFTSEAVSFLPVINALTPAISALLPTFGRGLDELQPVLNVLVPVLNDLEQKGYDAIAPQYEPYRQQILLAENELAQAFAPFVSQVVQLPTLPYLQSIEGIIAKAVGSAVASGALPTS